MSWFAVESKWLFRLTSISCSKLESGDTLVTSLKTLQHPMEKGASCGPGPVIGKIKQCVINTYLNLVKYPLLSVDLIS